jgi:hypothetical protein
MIKLAHFFEYYADRQNEFQTGWQLVGQSFTLITFETFAMVFCDKFGIVGTPALMIYIVAPVAAVLSVIYLGHKMIRSGYASTYLKANANVNADWKRLVANVEKLCKERENDE